MLKAAAYFAFEGTPVTCQRYGHGHINETYLVRTGIGKAYILQKINTRVFSEVPALMENIAAVTGWLSKSCQDPRGALTLVRTKEGEAFCRDGEGAYWRAYVFIEDSVCLDRAETPENMYQSGIAFGDFQNRLAGFPAVTLHETIPHFHDTPARFAALREAAAKDTVGRLGSVEAELAFAMARDGEADMLTSLLRKGELPLRVTHNDTKLNNVMLDAATRKPLCVIDLDTVMPGLAANDFGDTIRFGASTADEDEQDIEKVKLSLEMYRAYARGFLDACESRLTALEKKTLPWGAKLMTLECGVRFLTDYLNGDIYFAVQRPGHNLDRCRTQFALVRDMEEKWEAMQDITNR